MITNCMRSDHGIEPDWLSFSHAPLDPLTDEIVEILALAGYTRTSGPRHAKTQIFRHQPHGIPATLTGSVGFFFDERYTLVTISGNALRTLDVTGRLRDIVEAVMLVPSLRITRLDLALTVPCQTLSEVVRRLSSVRRKGRQGRIKLGQKSVPFDQVSTHGTARVDAAQSGRVVETGSVYIGKRSNVYSACIYDKRAQMADRHDLDIGYEAVRYEVRVRKGSATLRDLVQPDALFFQLASPDLVPRPDNVPPWESVPMEARLLPPAQEFTDYQRMTRLIEASSDLQALSLILERAPELSPFALQQLQKRIGMAKVRPAA